MRKDLELKDYAISLGYEIDYNHQDRLWKRTENPMFALTFKKGNKYIWVIKEGWQCADLLNGHFCNHRKYTELKNALDEKSLKFIR